ncbi:MAG: DsbA family oxidoreductase [Pseudomonadota bacterium]
MNALAQPVTIDVVSDVMCPWCLIGKRRLEQAMAAREGITFQVRWRPFQLDATIPEDGMDRQEYLSRKFGGPDGAKTVYDRVRAAGAEEGIDFKFEDIKKSPNTINAHRLLRWADPMGVQNEVAERLFSLYFLEGGDLTDKKVLADNAEKAGMEREVVETLLAGDADKEEVAQEIATATQMGVTGVPCFIIDGKYAVMGAQTPDVIGGAIDKVLEERADAESSTAS